MFAKLGLFYLLGKWSRGMGSVLRIFHFAFALSGRLDRIIHPIPRALPIGYGIMGFQPEIMRNGMGNALKGQCLIRI